MSTVKCFACGEMGQYVGQCPKKKKQQQDGTAATAEEEEFIAQFERECTFVNCCLSVDTPSGGWCANRVEEIPQIESGVSRGTQTQFSRTPSSGVTSPPGTASVSGLSSRQRVGTEASEHQRLMSGSRAFERLEPHLAMETSRLTSRSISGGSHLVRDQVEDLGEMPRFKYSW
jgi:hypothetical protein